MREISPDELWHLSEDAGVRSTFASAKVWAALKFEPRKRSFNVAKAALSRLGAEYDWQVRAWRVPLSEDALEPLTRLYRASSLALYLADEGEDVTRSHFDRYRP